MTRLAAVLAALALLVAHPQPAAATDYPDAVARARQWAQRTIGRVEFRCLDSIVAHESGWNPTVGSVTGSYGIGQATPGTVMAGYGRAWRTDPMLQTHWTIDYIARRYGSACQAWSWWQSHRSY